MTSWRSPRRGQVGAVARIGQQPLQEGAAPSQGRRRLQEGHEVQLGGAIGPTAASLAARSRTSRTSCGPVGEADDVAPAGLGPEVALDGGHGAERGEHVIERDARRRPRPSRRHAGPDRLERGAVDRGVLADLQARQVEAERARPPAQVLDLAVGDADQAVGDQRGLDLDELRVEAGGAP